MRNRRVSEVNSVWPRKLQCNAVVRIADGLQST